MNFAAEKHFNKKFSFKNSENAWVLPAVSNIFTGKHFQNAYLQQLKTQLNVVKSQLNNYVLDHWHQHTKSTNPAGRILWTVKKTCNPELLTQAWCKFYEIVSTYNIVPEHGEFGSLHLCEAPGAFITALNHYLQLQCADILQWKWLSSTMNPHYEGNPGTLMVSDDRFISLTLDHWNFGEDNTGNILSADNSLHLISAAKTSLKNRILLVTADGSIDCQEDPGEQENIVASLLLCEIITTLHVLQEGGNFILKGFTWYEESSICLLYLLVCTFRELHAFKPGSSKEGNSEVYLIAMGFHGQDQIADYLPCLMDGYKRGQFSESVLFPEESIPETFISQLCQAAHLFYNFQVEAIQRNVELFNEGISSNCRKRLNELREAVARSFIQRCQLQPIRTDRYIVGHTKLNQCSFIHLEVRSGEYSHTEQSILRNALRHAGQLSRQKAMDVLKAMIPSLQKLPEVNHQPLKVQKKVPSILQAGRRIPRILCSKFCRPWLLQLHYALWDIHSSLSLPAPAVPCPHVNCKFSVSANGELETTLSELLCILQKLRTGENVEVRCVSLLSCLYVGLIRLLIPCFSQISFYPCNYGACVQLQGFIARDLQLESFLQEVLQVQLGNEQQILSITPTPELCNGELYERIVHTNHCSIKLLAEETLKLLTDTPS